MRKPQKKLASYRIVTDVQGNLERDVNKLIQQGYELYGSPFNNGFTMVQCMILRGAPRQKLEETEQDEAWGKTMTVVKGSSDAEMMAIVEERKSKGWKVTGVPFINERNEHCYMMIKERET